MDSVLTVNGSAYQILRLLGKGKVGGIRYMNLYESISCRRLVLIR